MHPANQPHDSRPQIGPDLLIQPSNEPFLNIVLYQPEIPGNTGAVGRTAVALGAKLWLVRPLGFRLDEKTVRRAGLDYWEHLNLEVADHWEDLLERLPETRSGLLVSKSYDNLAAVDCES